MSYAPAGADGAVSTGASGAAVTPAWDAGAARTVNNLLVCWVVGWTTGTAVSPTTATGGWSGSSPAQIEPGSSGQAVAMMFLKVATGGDAAPTIAAAAGMTWAARVSEFSGNATTSVIDKTGTDNATSSPGMPTNSGVDTTTGELVAYAAVEFITTAATATMTGTPTNFTKNDVTNNAVSSQAHWLMGWGITTANSVADKTSITFDSATSNLAAVIASFNVPPPPPPVPTQSTLRATMKARR